MHILNGDECCFGKYNWIAVGGMIIEYKYFIISGRWSLTPKIHRLSHSINRPIALTIL